MKSEVQEHLSRAVEFLHAADLLKANQLYDIALGRAYYAMFHAATAALMEKGIERSSHHALIAAFGQFIVKPGLLDRRFLSYLQDAFAARIDGDYGSLPSADGEKVTIHIERARQFVQVCRALCI